MHSLLGLHPCVFTLPLVARLREEGLITDVDVIRIATQRENAGLNSSPIEHDLSLLLEAQQAEVRDLLRHDGGEQALTDDDKSAYLWIRLALLRSQVASLGDYQFYFEDLLDEYDQGNDYADMRFFRQDVSGRRTMNMYLRRIDTCLSTARDAINRAAADN